MQRLWRQNTSPYLPGRGPLLATALVSLFIFEPTVCTTSAGQIFSVNSTTDELVTIDTNTGAVSVVGPIGHEMQGADLASLNGLVYATTQKTPGFNLDGMTLVAIDPLTGGKVSSADIHLGTSEVFAEGLTAANDELIISFDHLSLTSRRTGVVDPLSGAISNAQFHGPDLDELGTDLTGQIIAVDGINFSGNTRQMAFFEVDRDPAGGAFIGDFLLQGSLDDIVFTPFGIFSLDHVNENLYRLELGPPSIAEVIPIGPVGLQLDGLAFIPGFDDPEPEPGPPFGPPFDGEPPFGPPFDGEPPFGPPQGEPPFGPPPGVPPGDGNLNGLVEAGDYTIWANGFGAASPQFTDGDYNGDGVVNAGDYTTWANSFGQSASVLASRATAVPEPSTFILTCIGLLGLTVYGWRRRSRA